MCSNILVRQRAPKQTASMHPHRQYSVATCLGVKSSDVHRAHYTHRRSEVGYARFSAKYEGTKSGQKQSKKGQVRKKKVLETESPLRALVSSEYSNKQTPFRSFVQTPDILRLPFEL